MKDCKYSDILKANSELGKTLGAPAYDIAVLSNIIVSQLKDILEYSARLGGVNAQVAFGDYDNIVQDSGKFNRSKCVIIFWETANLINGFQHKADVIEQATLTELIEKLKSEIDYVLSNLMETPLVLINKFSSLLFNSHNIEINNFDRVCEQLNNHLEKKRTTNIHVIDIDKIIAQISVEKSINFRYFYSSKALYSIDFFKKYSEQIKCLIFAATGKAKKVLIFDCDNTLWKGILGEDGFDGIEMSAKTALGSVYDEVQCLALTLSKKGVLIGLCSKNNLQDVDNVLFSHPDIVLKNENISVKKINWNDKVENLHEISKELNIGLDSIVFLDDSDFEINYVKNRLPQVTALQVPSSNIYEYPGHFRRWLSLFHNLAVTAEDRKKVTMYQEQLQRDKLKSAFSNLDEYLRTLQLKVLIFVNNAMQLPRIAQLTQKTNQFNVTTKRYTEAEIRKLIDSNGHVISFEVADKFGNYGLTGLIIVISDENQKMAAIDVFLLSCRIIGRNIEYAVFDYLIRFMTSLHIQKIQAQYRKTLKNDQVSDLFERLGFTRVSANGETKDYLLTVQDYKPHNFDYIEVSDGETA
jgi:FkbH-like protein